MACQAGPIGQLACSITIWLNQRHRGTADMLHVCRCVKLTCILFGCTVSGLGVCHPHSGLGAVATFKGGAQQSIGRLSGMVTAALQLACRVRNPQPARHFIVVDTGVGGCA